MQRLNAGGDDDIAGVEPVGDHDRTRIEAQQLDVAQRDGQLRRIDDPDRRLAVQFGQCGGRDRNHLVRLPGPLMPFTVEPSRIASGGSVRPTLTWKVRVTGSACGATSRTRPIVVTLGIVGQAYRDLRIAWRGPQHLGGHVEHRVASTLPRELHDHLSRLHHLARFRAAGGYRSGGIGLQHRVAHPVGGDSHLHFAVIDLRLRRAQCLLGQIELGSRRVALRQQCPLPFERRTRLGQLRLRRRQARLGRAQRVHLVLRIQSGEFLSGLDLVADIDEPLGHPPADAECHRRLVFRLDMPGQHDRLAGILWLGRHRSHRARLGDRSLFFRSASCQPDRHSRQQPKPKPAELHAMTSRGNLRRRRRRDRQIPCGCTVCEGGGA